MASYITKPVPKRLTVESGPPYYEAVKQGYLLVSFALEHNIASFKHPILTYGMDYTGIIYSAINPSSGDLQTYVFFLIVFILKFSQSYLLFLASIRSETH
jgi:hypothetical protein